MYVNLFLPEVVAVVAVFFPSEENIVELFKLEPELLLMLQQMVNLRILNQYN